jgi:hypothetical protein
VKTCTFAFTTVLAAVMLIPSITSAEWNPGDKFKWVQMPDVIGWGTDINVSLDAWYDGTVFHQAVADDFLCTTTGPITGIQLWGSWLHDGLPEVYDPWGVGEYYPDATNVKFNLTIYDNLTADQNPKGFRSPNYPLWSKTFNPGEFMVRGEAYLTNQNFLHPIHESSDSSSAEVLEYSFDIPEDEAFIQQGTETDWKVYWLKVTAVPLSSSPYVSFPVFGWRTTDDHWNGKAVAAPGDIPANWPNTLGWELMYDHGSPIQEDMAFVISPEPGTFALISLAGLMLLRRK